MKVCFVWAYWSMAVQRGSEEAFKVGALPRIKSDALARVKATFRRLGSAKKPSELPGVGLLEARTQLNTIMSFS
jgi:hypothetical protein